MVKSKAKTSSENLSTCEIGSWECLPSLSGQHLIVYTVYNVTVEIKKFHGVVFTVHQNVLCSELIFDALLQLCVVLKPKPFALLIFLEIIEFNVSKT